MSNILVHSPWKHASLLSVARTVCSEMVWLIFFATNKEVVGAVTVHEDFILAVERVRSDQSADPHATSFLWVLAHSQGTVSPIRQSCSTPVLEVEQREESLAHWMKGLTVLGTYLVLMKHYRNKRFRYSTGSCITSPCSLLWSSCIIQVSAQRLEALSLLRQGLYYIFLCMSFLILLLPSYNL